MQCVCLNDDDGLLLIIFWEFMMEANSETWCTVDALARCYVPHMPLHNAESFRKYVTLMVLAHFPNDMEMLEGVEWDKLRAYYIALRDQ